MDNPSDGDTGGDHPQEELPNLAIGKRGVRPFTRRNQKSNNMKNELWTTYSSLLGGIMDDKVP